VTADDVIDRFFAAIEQGDRDAIVDLYAPDIQVWHSFTGQTVGKEDALQIVFAAMVPDMTVTYEEQERVTVGDLTARRHLFHAVFSNGVRLTIPTAIFIRIRDDKIMGFHEYMDSKLIDEVTNVVMAAER
jgi:ketosteroid isomerase-like protein